MHIFREKDKAFEWLEAALAERDAWVRVLKHKTPTPSE